jgi:hypothetical protein
VSNDPTIRPRRQRGVAAVEFAVVSSIFFTMLIGVMEMGRLLWTWNAAVEATRLGARLAVVCDLNDTTVRDRMVERLPTLDGSSNVQIQYLPAGCTPATCLEVRVSLTGYQHDTVMPFVPLSLTLPPFSTTLRKEFMSSAGNPVCN